MQTKSRKILILALVLVIAWACGGCHKNTPTEPTETTIMVETTEATTEPTTEPTTEATTEPTTEATEEITEPTETEPEPTEPPGVPGIVVIASMVNVREAAGTNQKKVCQLARGTEVTVYELVTVAGKQWGRIDQGWICMDYVKLSGELPEPGREPTQTTEATEPTSETTTTEPTTPGHEHKYTAKVTKPTCAANGYTLYTCGCGASYTDDVVMSTGHKWGEWVTTKKPTTTSEGTAERKCSVCGSKETKVLPKEVAGHTHSYTGEVTKAATCSAEGVKTFTCSCGASYTESLPRTAHSYKDTVVKPTCTAGGYTSHTCSVCGSSYTDRPTSPAGHKYTATVVKPTCTANGFTAHTCTVCNHSYSDSATTALGHRFGEWVVTRQPTETSTGSKERTCSACNYKETQAIDKLAGHTCNFVPYEEVAPTCTADGYFKTKCSTCGKAGSNTPSGSLSRGHSWSVTDSQPASCTSDGYTTETCSVCGNSRTNTVHGGHNWQHHHKDATGHYTSIQYNCSCGATFGSLDSWVAHNNEVMLAGGVGHSYSNSQTGWVEDSPAIDYDYCTVCNIQK